jgi:ubiquinone/menaquinone biosynthesis C-methylase UbiE
VWLVDAMPARARRRLGLDDVEALTRRRLEIGGGSYPTPGFVHVDLDPYAEHLEAYAPAWSLPLPDGWARELLAVHSLEHVEPPRLRATLREWLRVLEPGGRVRIHVPNTAELMQAYAASPPREKWRVMGALLGMYCAADVSAPEELEARCDHQVFFDGDLLRELLVEVGFQDVQDRTGQVSDRHTEAWKSVVPHFSLVFEGRRGQASAS